MVFIALLGYAADTVFLLINSPGAIQNIDREPLFCTLFAKQKSVQFCLIHFEISPGFYVSAVQVL